MLFALRTPGHRAAPLHCRHWQTLAAARAPGPPDQLSFPSGECHAALSLSPGSSIPT